MAWLWFDGCTKALKRLLFKVQLPDYFLSDEQASCGIKESIMPCFVRHEIM
jgi:hypothetical protein